MGAYVATRLLSRLHHRDPTFPVEAIHQRITPATARTAADEAVASHVAQVVSKLQRG